tara:strand:+ start:1280 stop:2371 length:1092 start_codon:yes stop_codon:yes gene_type:complete
MGKIFNKIYSKIESNLIAKKAGKVTTISPPFPRLALKYPGWERGKYTIITANSGIGKTKFAKFMTITNIYNFIKLNPDVVCKIKYFALEETEEEFWLSFISAMLYEKYTISLSTAQLKSLGSFTISDDILDKVKECELMVDELSAYVEVIDYIHNGFGIYKNVREFFENPEIGTNITIKDKDNKDIVIGYKHNFPDTYYFVVTDQINLLSPESKDGVKMDLWESMGHFSKEYCLKGFCKRYNCVTVVLQQQEAAKEKKEYYKGEVIEDKIEPSLDGLANNKETQRDCDVCIGIFAPNRYSITTYRNYNISKLGDKVRFLKFLKDRHYGCTNVYVPLYFDGATGFHKELPRAEDMTQTIYDSIK